MTSKISFFKLMKEDLKRRSWLVALVWVACFILQPMVLMLRLESVMSAVNGGYMEKAYAINTYRSYVGFENEGLALFVILTAVVVGASGFAFLHSRVKLDFFHSLPVTRKKFFFVQYLSGILMFVVPYTVCSLICMLIGMANGLLTGAVAVYALKVIPFRILEFLSAYGTMILACVLTGKLLNALLGGLALAGYLPLVLSVLVGMKSLFFSTYLQDTNGSMRVMLHTRHMLLSPVFVGSAVENMLEKNAQMLHNGKWIVIGTGMLVFWILVTTGVALRLAVLRKTEAAEQAMAFPKTEGIVKVLLVIPLSLATGLFVQDMLYASDKKWFFIAAIGTVVLLSAVVEFIYHTNMKEIFRHKLQILLTGIATLAIALFFFLDVSGYDTYLPAKEDVGKMALYNEQINGNFYYPELGESDGAFQSYSPESALRNTLISDFDPIYELARKGARGEKPSEEDGRTICVEYRLKDGRTEFRQYLVDRKDLEKAMTALFSDEEYVEKTYPIFWRETDLDTSSEMYVEGLFGSEILKLTKEQKQEFLDVYRKELRTISYQDLNENTRAAFSVSIVSEEQYDPYLRSSTSYSENGYPICEKFTETIAYLKEKAGLDVTRQISEKDVRSVEIMDYRNREEESIQIDDPEQIRQILEKLEYTPLYFVTDDSESISIFLTMVDGQTSMGRPYFKKGNVPDFLMKNE